MGEAAILRGIWQSLKILENVEVNMLSFNSKEDKKRYGKKVKIVPFLFQNFQNHSKLQILVAGVIYILMFITFAITYFLIGKLSNKIFRQEIWKSFVDSDILIFGHDAYLENSVTRKENIFAKNLTFLSTFFTMLIAKNLMKKKISIYGGGIGPKYNKILEILARYTLNKIDLITLREAKSFEYIKKIGVKKQFYPLKYFQDTSLLSS